MSSQSGAAARFEQGLFLAFLAVLVWAPLPFASNRVWSAALLAALIGGLASAWLVMAALGKARFTAITWRNIRLPLCLLLLVQAWVWLQAISLPPGVIQWLSPQAHDWHVRQGWLTISLDPFQTRYYLLRGLTITFGFLLSAALVNSKARLHLLLQVLVFSGTFQAAYGAFMVLSGLELGFFVEKYAGKGVTTGTFVNRNHLAGYLVMCLSAGIGLLISQLSRGHARGWRDRARRWLQLMLSSKVRLRIYLAVMVVALVLTRSRMGNIAFFASLSVAGLLYLFALRRFNSRMLLFLSSILVVDLIILGRWFGLDKLVQRLEETTVASESRVWSNDYTVDMLRDFPVTGSGGGSFYGVFPNYQGEALSGYHIHAHNDYLEFAVELGLFATGVLVCFVILAAVMAWRTLQQRQTPLYRGAAFAVLMTICWAAIHSTTDFNLQVPANALTFVVILSLAFVCRALPGAKL